MPDDIRRTIMFTHPFNDLYRPIPTHRWVDNSTAQKWGKSRDGGHKRGWKRINDLFDPWCGVIIRRAITRQIKRRITASSYQFLCLYACSKAFMQRETRKESILIYIIILIYIYHCSFMLFRLFCCLITSIFLYGRIWVKKVINSFWMEKGPLSPWKHSFPAWPINGISACR